METHCVSNAEHTLSWAEVNLERIKLGNIAQNCLVRCAQYRHRG